MLPSWIRSRNCRPAVGIALGDADHQAQVGFDQFLLGRFGFLVGLGDDLQRAAQFRRRSAELPPRAAAAAAPCARCSLRSSLMPSAARRPATSPAASARAPPRAPPASAPPPRARSAVDQVTDHRALELARARTSARGTHHQPAQLPQLPAVLLGLHAARDGLQLLPALQDLPVVARDLFDGQRRIPAASPPPVRR